MRKVLIGVLAVAAVAVTVYVAAAWLTPERVRAERAVRRLAGRLEARDAAGACLLLTEDYHDSQGYGSRADFRAAATVGLRMVESLSIELSDMNVEVTEDERGRPRAVAKFLAALAARQAEHQDVWNHKSRVRLALRKEEGEWRICEADYSLPPMVRRQLDGR